MEELHLVSSLTGPSFKVYTSGRVMAYSYARNLPGNGYLGATSATPTIVRDSVDIPWN